MQNDHALIHPAMPDAHVPLIRKVPIQTVLDICVTITTISDDKRDWGRRDYVGPTGLRLTHYASRISGVQIQHTLRHKEWAIFFFLAYDANAGYTPSGFPQENAERFMVDRRWYRIERLTFQGDPVAFQRDMVLAKMEDLAAAA